MTPFPLMNIEDIYEIIYILARHTSMYNGDMDYAEARWFYRRLGKEFEEIKKAREQARSKIKRRRRH